MDGVQFRNSGAVDADTQLEDAASAAEPAREDTAAASVDFEQPQQQFQDDGTTEEEDGGAVEQVEVGQDDAVADQEQFQADVTEQYDAGQRAQLQRAAQQQAFPGTRSLPVGNGFSLFLVLDQGEFQIV